MSFMGKLTQKAFTAKLAVCSRVEPAYAASWTRVLDLYAKSAAAHLARSFLLVFLGGLLLKT